ncbi:MAG: SsrA-binding protein SmpB [Kiritimatiellae bacterium]|nr:SsrA-binding protein SmpB [Kiritimatiellia bacterium]
MAKQKNKTPSTEGGLATNRKTLRDYHVLESFEAGIVLLGTEVKSMRNRQISMEESYVRIDRGEAVLINLNILAYDHGNQFNHDPVRKRKLLLHKREIERLTSQIQLKGLALIPLKIYVKKGFIKLQLGLCKGKQMQDKREDMKRKTADREAERAMTRRR